MITMILKYGGALVLFLVGYWAVLFLMQRRMMFPAPMATGGDRTPADARQVWLPGVTGPTEAWFLPPTGVTAGPVAGLIFGHGNGELIDYWPDAFGEPRAWGMAVLLVEYPGYGRSAGDPTQRTIAAAFSAGYDWMISEGGVDPHRVVGYGRSLGAGAVTQLSLVRPLAALILESAFTSARPFARRLGAPGFLVRDPFDNLAAVRTFTGPLLVMHGAEDEIVPSAHGRALAEAGGVPLHELPCGHNDCPQSWPTIGQFLVDAHVLAPGPAGG